MRPKSCPQEETTMVLLALALLGVANALRTPPIMVRPHIASRRATALPRKSQVFDDVPSVDESSSSMMTLNFQGNTCITSKQAALVEGMPLHEFFALPQSAPIILRGSKNNRVKETIDAAAATTTLMERYKVNCGKVNASTPSGDERIFEVTTSGVKFPGLQVISIVIIGVKLVISNTGYPCYEMVLIQDSTRAEGNRLFVWFFNKVTGKDSSTAKTSEQTTFSLNRISAVAKGSDMIAFEANANLNLKLQFPTLLMKAIPGASKEKFEKTGGESLRKALEDDLPAALESFRQEYTRWLKKNEG